METAKLFENGKSQAVRLPKEFRFSGDRVFVKRVGNAVVLIPHNAPWESLISSLALFTTDYLNNRQQPEVQERDGTFQ